MHKATFLTAIAKFETQLIKSLRRVNVVEEFAKDAVHEMICRQLENKSYLAFKGDVIDNKMYGFLNQSARWVLQDMAKRAQLERTIFVSIETRTEEDRDEFVDTRERTEEGSITCPFCHDAELNAHATDTPFPSYSCANCHTILGQGKSVHEHMSIDEADLLSLPSMELSTDVQIALGGLTDLERKVIEHCAMGNDTLNGLEELTGIGRDSLWRVYVRAKRKLQTVLSEYQ